MIALQQERGALRWVGSLAAVLAVHAVIVAAMLGWRSHTPPAPPEPAAAVMVELAPLPSAPPAPPTQSPPGPPQQEQRKAQPKAAPQPVATPEPQRKPLDDAEIALPQQAPARQHEDSAASDVAQTSAPPSVQAPTGSQYAARQSLAGAASQGMANWQAQVLGQLEQFKRYPRAAARRHYEGTAMVRYSVDRQGRVLSVRLDASSGSESLDSEAVAAVQRASPLPPPPAEIPGDPVEVTTPVRFSLR